MSNINSIGVIGAGQMGRGIAQVAIQSSFTVHLYDISFDSCNAAKAFIKAQLDKGTAKGKWSKEDSDKALNKLNLITDLNDLKDCDLVIEAATENKNIKLEIFSNLDKILKEEAILATNTSSIPITEIAAVTNRPDKVVGMHFMNPVPVMKLIEGIKGLITSEETFLKIEEVSNAFGKTFVKSQDRPGFIVNRILMPMINEAIYCVYEGVGSPKDIDTAMKLGTNQPMGPLELADFIGLDTCLSIMEVLYDGFKDSKYRPCPLLRQYVTAKKLGRKVKKGFYDYE